MRFRPFICIATCLLLSACVTQEVRKVDLTPPTMSETPVAEDLLLDVGVSIFDANVPEDYDERVENMIQPEVRRAEANYMPYVAKNLLQSTGNWGAVRVVPRPTDAVDIIVTGKILESNGERLTLQMGVHDATGRHWFTRKYHTLASKYAYDDTMPADVDAFQAVYRELSDDMLKHMQAMNEEDIRRIRSTAEMKFARGFVPDAFGSHIEENDDGYFELLRLPAENDPMLDRVRRVREREYLFIDTLDEYYSEFHRSMYASYQNWRSATFDEAIANRQLKEQARSRMIGGTLAIVGSVGAIYESDNPYVDYSALGGIAGGVTLIKTAVAKRNEAAMHAEVLREVGTAAEAELIPYTMDLENQTYRLQGSVEEQYQELRRILRRAYFEDLGLPVPEQDEGEEAAAGTSLRDNG